MKRLIFLVGLIASGCGVGAGVMIHNVDLDPKVGNQYTGIEHSRELQVVSPVITLYDSTGMLVAGLGTAGNAHTAKREARERAMRRKDAKVGDTYSYSYRQLPPAAGTVSALSFTWGSTEKLRSFADPDNPVEVDDVIDFYGLDLQVSFGEFEIADPIWGEFRLGMQWWDYSSESEQADGMWIGMPLTFALSFNIDFLGISPAVYVSVDPLVSPLLLALREDDEESWLWYQAGVELDIGLVSFLSIASRAFYGQTPLEFGKQPSTNFGFNASLVVHWPDD